MSDNRKIDAVLRLSAWLHEYGQDKPMTFVEDLVIVLAMARDSLQAHPAEDDEPADCRGPISSERWTLDELIAELEKWKKVASGKTCVSFENICYGASSLWHQTHRENFRDVDRKPEALSRWVLKYANCVMEDFPAQVLQILESLVAENERLKRSSEGPEL